MKKQNNTKRQLSWTGLKLTTGFLLTLLVMWLFTGVIIGIVFTDSFVYLDIRIALFLQRFQSPELTLFFKVITDFGSWGVMVISVAVVVVCLYNREWFLAVMWCISVGGALLINILIKIIAQRQRPLDQTMDLGYSFPSGHAMVSSVSYGLLAWYLFLCIEKPLYRHIILWSSMILILLVGFSRMYLEVHYFSDIVGGYVAGTLWLLFCTESLTKRKKKIKRISNK